MKKTIDNYILKSKGVGIILLIRNEWMNEETLDHVFKSLNCLKQIIRENRNISVNYRILLLCSMLWGYRWCSNRWTLDGYKFAS